MMNLAAHMPAGATAPELAVCMADTLLHLPSRAAAAALCTRVHSALAPGGAFILTFRDMSTALRGLDRFISVRSDDSTVFTCFLEYDDVSGETVTVHAIVHRRAAPAAPGWVMHESCFQKLRLSSAWVVQALRDAGFCEVTTGSGAGGFVVVTARGAGAG